MKTKSILTAFATLLIFSLETFASLPPHWKCADGNTSRLICIGAGNPDLVDGETVPGFTYWVGDIHSSLQNISLNVSNGLSIVYGMNFNVPDSNASQVIALPGSWSMFSTNIQANNPDITEVLDPVLPNLMIVKNGAGYVYWPQYGINSIGNIQLGQGYQIKMNYTDTLLVQGVSIQPDTISLAIPLGWSILGYLRATPASIHEMLSPIVENVSIVKDGVGQTYWPQYGINMIENMNPGQGYLIKTQNTDTLIYPTNIDTAFACGDQIVDFDGNIYNTVLIGYQCWMKENLRTTHYSNGIPILNGSGAGNTYGDYSTKYYFDYSNNPANSLIYGRLYNFAAAMNGAASSNAVPSGVQGVCPVGWHVPGDEEWKMLEGSVDSQFDYPDVEWDGDYWRGSDAALILKSESGWVLNGNGTDFWGFSARPGGGRDYVNYTAVGFRGFWWTSTEHNSLFALDRNLSYFYDKPARNIRNKVYASSVRCLLDTMYVQADIPTVVTNPLTHIAYSSAIGGGDVIADGGALPTIRGICWNTNGNPTVSDSVILNSYGMGSYPCNLDGLESSTTYFARAFATNSAGTGYGNELQFTTDTAFICGDSIFDYEGNYYQTVQIGTQCWMKENLRSTIAYDGTELTDGANEGNISGDYTTRYYFDCENNPANSDPYGKLYTYAAAMNGDTSSNAVPSGTQGLCPSGWHVPSDEEWKILEGAADNQYPYPDPEWDAVNERGHNAGINLIATSTWGYNYNGYGNGLDLYGFSALASGWRKVNNVYNAEIGKATAWWSASESENYGGNCAWYRSLSDKNSGSWRSDYLSKANALSVRCVKYTNPSTTGLPSINTDSIIHITNKLAIIGATVTDYAGALVTSRGICWNTTGNPTLADSITPDGQGLGSFECLLAYLSANTTYFVRAYATNSVGTSYGAQLQFTTDSTFSCGDMIIDFDENLYNTVQIGDQCWMKKNLVTTHYADGTSMVNGTDLPIAANDSTKYYFYPNGNIHDVEKYGYLYRWLTVMNGDTLGSTPLNTVQGVCPNGWHVPSDEEWKMLEGSVDSVYGYPDPVWDSIGWYPRGYNAGHNLKSTTFYMGGADLYGFTGLASGRCSDGDSFITGNDEGNWWTSTSVDSSKAMYRRLYFTHDGVQRNPDYKYYGLSVRCVKD